MPAYELTPEQIAEYKKAFDILDKDKDGSITTKELGAVVKATGRKTSEASLKQMIKSVDVDKSGTLDFDEFQTLMIREVKKDEMERLRSVFRAMDKDKDGIISIRECQVALRNSGCSDADIGKRMKKIFKTSDFDRDGEIKYEGVFIIINHEIIGVHFLLLCRFSFKCSVHCLLMHDVKKLLTWPKQLAKDIVYCPTFFLTLSHFVNASKI